MTGPPNKPLERTAHPTRFLACTFLVEGGPPLTGGVRQTRGLDRRE
jgi:hypothetical protein